MKKVAKIIIILIIISIIISLIYGIINAPKKEPEFGTEEDKTYFNNHYADYEGQKVGSVVKALILEAEVSNLNDEDKSNNRKLTIILDGKEVESTSQIESTSMYEVKIPKDGYAKNGYIKKIEITKINK